MNFMPMFSVHGRHGRFHVDASTGLIVNKELDCTCEYCQDNPTHCDAITRFDVGEWEKTYQSSIVGQQLDILDLGFWYGEEDLYEEACLVWRKEILRKRMTI